MKRVVKCYGCGEIVRTSAVYVVYYSGGNLKDKRVRICPVCYEKSGFRVTSKAKRKAFNLDPLYSGTSTVHIGPVGQPMLAYRMASEEDVDG